MSQSGSECRSVIIGERHTPRIGRWCQEKLIVMLKPKYVLVETFQKDVPDLWFQRWKENYCCIIDMCDINEDEKTGTIDQDDIRETRMGELIIDFSEKSSKPLIVIIGNWHARPASRIHEILKRHIDYVCIWEKDAVTEVEEKRRFYKL